MSLSILSLSILISLSSILFTRNGYNDVGLFLAVVSLVVLGFSYV